MADPYENERYQEGPDRPLREYGGWEDMRDLYDLQPDEFVKFLGGNMPWRNLQNPGKIEYQRRPGEWATFDEEDFFRDIVPGLMGLKPFAPVYDMEP